MTSQPQKDPPQRVAAAPPSPEGTKPSASDPCQQQPSTHTGAPGNEAEAMDEIDEAIDESFPASDPPSYTGGSATPSVPKNK